MAIKTYNETDKIQLSKNFNSYEFRCGLGSPCSCTTVLIDDKLVEYLQKIRDHFNQPITITSAYRCPSYNKKIGGATGSRHSKGQAADIVVKNIAPKEVAKYAESIGILGIGLYETNTDGHFTHIDTRTTKSFWYGQNEAYRSTFGGTPIQEEEKEEIKIDISKVNTSAADPKVIWDFLKRQGLNDFGIAGLMGNLEAESGLKPTNLQNTYEQKLGMTDAEYTAAVDQGIYDNFVKDSAGYGLAQWTYSTRKQNLLNYCKNKNKSIGDLEAQLEFLIKELSTNYTSSVYNVLKNAKTVLEASNAVLIKYENPANQGTSVQKSRASLGQTYYDKYATKATITIPDTNTTGKMKYSSNNKPLVCMQTQSTCYKGTSNMSVFGVLWHSTGANNPNLKRYIQPSDNDPNRDEWLNILGINSNGNDWNHIVRQAGVNAWIGKLANGNVTTIQTMPWNYKPWGCGQGSNGSCNNGWIQFEICEDALTNKTYFNTVYQEACELTAYICFLYNIDPYGTVKIGNQEVPTILCHADSYKLGLGSNHGDVLHWFTKFGKTMEDVRNDVAQLMGKNISQDKEEVPKELYRVRKNWEDSVSQVGAYTSLENAKAACDKAGVDYEVYNNEGIAIYPESIIQDNSTNIFKVGDEVKLTSDAVWAGNKEIQSWVFRAKLYVRDFAKNGNIIVSTKKTGAITGVLDSKYLLPYNTTTTTSNFSSYIVRIDTDVLNVRAGAGTGYKITTQVFRNEHYTIIGEKDKWGKLKSGAGWICLDYVKKVK